MLEWVAGLFYYKDSYTELAISEDWLHLNLDGTTTCLDTASKTFTKADFEVVEKLYLHLHSKHRDITKEYLPNLRDRELKMIKASKHSEHITKFSGFLRNPRL